MNSRKITASIIVNSPIDDVWSIITDYNHLAVHVPNLVKSYVIAPDGNSASPALAQSSFISTSATSRSNENKNVRIFQEGAQKIVGFDFRASLTIDMREEEESEGRALKENGTRSLRDALNFLVKNGVDIVDGWEGGHLQPNQTSLFFDMREQASSGSSILIFLVFSWQSGKNHQSCPFLTNSVKAKKRELPF